MLKYWDETLLVQTSTGEVSAQHLATMVAKIGCIIFVVEALIMVALSSWKANVSISEGILDAAILTIVVSPMIYVWVARPFAEETTAARQELAAKLVETRSLLDQNVRLKDSLQAFSEVNAEIHERALQRIGAELHDGPAQTLAFSLLQLDRLARAMQRAGDNARCAEVAELRRVIDETASEVRGISTGLSLPELRAKSLYEVVALAVDRHKLATRTDAAVVFIAPPGPASQAHKAAIYRVIQESLTNAHKHGKAATVRVRVERTPALTISVIDDGQGFDIDLMGTQGLGLVGMRARVLALRGQLEVTSTRGQGTTVVARFDEHAIAQGAVHD